MSTETFTVPAEIDPDADKCEIACVMLAHAEASRDMSNLAITILKGFLAANNCDPCAHHQQPPAP